MGRLTMMTIMPMVMLVMMYYDDDNNDDDYDYYYDYDYYVDYGRHQNPYAVLLRPTDS